MAEEGHSEDQIGASQGTLREGVIVPGGERTKIPREIGRLEPLLPRPTDEPPLHAGDTLTFDTLHEHHADLNNARPSVIPEARKLASIDPTRFANTLASLGIRLESSHLPSAEQLQQLLTREAQRRTERLERAAKDMEDLQDVISRLSNKQLRELFGLKVRLRDRVGHVLHGLSRALDWLDKDQRLRIEGGSTGQAEMNTLRPEERAAAKSALTKERDSLDRSGLSAVDTPGGGHDSDHQVADGTQQAPGELTRDSADVREDTDQRSELNTPTRSDTPSEDSQEGENPADRPFSSLTQEELANYKSRITALALGHGGSQLVLTELLEKYGPTVFDRIVPKLATGHWICQTYEDCGKDLDRFVAIYGRVHQNKPQDHQNQ